MSGGMPELGSRISLISKADIRYEGRLFTVDPQECTIALAGVQSFGTEDRETACPIAPQSQIYEYILFRGSDIKDIRVINNCAIPNDPAIMQMHMPSQQQPMMQPFHAPGYNMNAPPAPSAIGVGSNQNHAFSQLAPANFSAPKQSQNLSDITSKQSKPFEASDNSEATNDLKGSRSATPSNLRKSPTNDTASQTNKVARNNYNNYQPQKAGQFKQQFDQRERMHRNPQGNQNNGRWAGQRPHMNHQNHQNHMNNRNRHHRGRPPLTQRPFNGPGRNPGNRRNVLKFENDYDFEQANNKFEELRSQLAKVKIGEEPAPSDDTENPPPPPAINEDDQDDIGYDKTKSFFDNISCEAIERSRGKTQRTDWRQEKKLNTETFGVPMNRRNFRPRGYGRNRPQNPRPPMPEN